VEKHFIYNSLIIGSTHCFTLCWRTCCSVRGFYL